MEYSGVELSRVEWKRAGTGREEKKRGERIRKEKRGVQSRVE